ncbi:MAG: hypothetical protein JWO95_1328 [Verrucomicrobiales bacterium]|nr:hypothetical protein [Verrucomicrobiales bacterium]
MAADLAATPESPHTSIKASVEHCAAQGQLNTLRGDSPAASQVNVEAGQWLFPIEDRRNQNGQGLAGLLPDLSLTGYLQLVDWSSRRVRPGKVSLSAHVPNILTRLQIDVADWKATLEKLLGSTKQVGTYFGSLDRLKQVAGQRVCKFLKNVAGREVSLTAPSAG